LDALAAAALQASNNNIKTVANLTNSLTDVTKEEEGERWMTVGIFKTLTQNVQNYVDFQWPRDMTSENLPDISLLEKVTLEQGKAYRFRVAGINSCGVGEFSEVIARQY